MNRAHRILVLTTLVSCLVTSVAIAGKEHLAEGDEADVSYDGLHRIKRSVMDEAYVKPDIDLNGYTKIMIDPVEGSYKRKPPPPAASMRASGSRSNFALTDQQMEQLTQLFHEAFVEAMTTNSGWVVVETSGPNVLRIEAGLVDLVVKVPTRPSTSQTHYFVSDIGEVTLVAEIRDSQSREVLARVADRSLIKTAGSGDFAYTTGISARADVRRLFDAWASLIRGSSGRGDAAGRRAAWRVARARPPLRHVDERMFRHRCGAARRGAPQAD